MSYAKKALTVLLLLGLLVTSCASVDESANEADVQPSVEDIEGGAEDILLTSESHILIAKWYGGVAVSNDAGNTWSDVDSIPIREFTIDQNGRIWGYHRWHGIHEPSQATLTYSDDEGYTWETIELEPSVVMPEAFITQWYQTPIIVACDGQLWKYSEPEKSGWSAWSRLGEPIPKDPEDYGYGRTGVQSEKAIYVSSKNFIWMTQDLGSTWVAFAAKDIQEMCCDHENSYAVSRDGVLYQTESGSTNWEIKITLPEVVLVFGMAAKNGCVYVAAEAYKQGAYVLGDPPPIQGKRYASIPIIEKDGAFRTLPGLKGPQAYSVRIGPDGNAWAVSDEAYREDESSWQPIWPE